MTHFVLSNYTMAWDITNFLTNSKSTLDKWFGLTVVIVGLIVLFVGVWMIASGLMSHGKKQTNWIIAILCLVIGGAMATTGGWDLVKTIGDGGKTTITELGTGGKTTTTTTPKENGKK